MSQQQVRLLEECGLNAWPALQQVHLNGWLLRFADGFTRRANSVQTLYNADAGLPVEQRIEVVEGVYQARGLAPTFRITPASEPAGLDDLLASRAYVRAGETSMLTRTLEPLVEDSVDPAFDDRFPDARVLLTESLSGNPDTAVWLQACTRLHNRNSATRHIQARMLDSIVTRTCYVLIAVGEQPAACAMGVLQQNQLGIYEVARDENFRGRGYGQAAVRLLEDWARAYGTEQAYLACEAINRPALQVYADAGYTESYRYWYRSLPGRARKF